MYFLFKPDNSRSQVADLNREKIIIFSCSLGDAIWSTQVYFITAIFAISKRKFSMFALMEVFLPPKKSFLCMFASISFGNNLNLKL